LPTQRNEAATRESVPERRDAVRPSVDADEPAGRVGHTQTRGTAHPNALWAGQDPEPDRLHDAVRGRIDALDGPQVEARDPDRPGTDGEVAGLTVDRDPRHDRVRLRIDASDRALLVRDPDGAGSEGNAFRTFRRANVDRRDRPVRRGIDSYATPIG
jgi:hypothetical protein